MGFRLCPSSGFLNNTKKYNVPDLCQSSVGWWETPNLKVPVLWDIALRSSYMNRHFKVKAKVKLRPTDRHTSGTRDKFFFLLEIFLWQLRVCYFVVLSLTRGRFCNLLLLLVPASAAPRDSRPYFIVPILETSPTRRGKSPYLYPLGIGWPRYIPGHWILTDVSGEPRFIYRLHSAISERVSTFITTSVKSSNPAHLSCLGYWKRLNSVIVHRLRIALSNRPNRMCVWHAVVFIALYNVWRSTKSKNTIISIVMNRRRIPLEPT
jgi:hypothetical protein